MPRHGVARSGMVAPDWEPREESGQLIYLMIESPPPPLAGGHQGGGGRQTTARRPSLNAQWNSASRASRKSRNTATRFEFRNSSG